MEALARLSGAVAHDFNNLFMVIRSYTELLASSIPAEEAPRRYLAAITRTSERMGVITGQMLAFGQRQLLAPVALNLNDSLAKFVLPLRSLLNKGIELRLVQEPSLWIVRADPSQINRLLMNLAANARDAMPEGGTLTVETRNVVIASEQIGERDALTPAVPGNYVMLSVTDTGEGIAPEFQEKIFEPFFTTKSPRTGRGMGLAAVHGIVRQSGGSVFCESAQGQGATFRIYLPSESESGSRHQLCKLPG